MMLLFIIDVFILQLLERINKGYIWILKKLSDNKACFSNFGSRKFVFSCIFILRGLVNLS